MCGVGWGGECGLEISEKVKLHGPSRCLSRMFCSPPPAILHGWLHSYCLHCFCSSIVHSSYRVTSNAWTLLLFNHFTSLLSSDNYLPYRILPHNKPRRKGGNMLGWDPCSGSIDSQKNSPYLACKSVLQKTCTDIACALSNLDSALATAIATYLDNLEDGDSIQDMCSEMKQGASTMPLMRPLQGLSMKLTLKVLCVLIVDNHVASPCDTALRPSHERTIYNVQIYATMRFAQIGINQSLLVDLFADVQLNNTSAAVAVDWTWPFLILQFFCVFITLLHINKDVYL